MAADPKPTSRPEQAYEVQEIYATIAQLPEDFRMALVAVDVLGLSYREAARALRVREATLTTRAVPRAQAGRRRTHRRARAARATGRDATGRLRRERSLFE